MEKIKKEKLFFTYGKSILLLSNTLNIDWKKEVLKEFSKIDFQNFIYPLNNIYCNSINNNQIKFNFKIYDNYITNKLNWNIEYLFWKKSINVKEYLNNKYQKNTWLWIMFNTLLKDNKELLKLYKKEDFFNFKQKIFLLNNWVRNDDILTILFFLKNNIVDKKINLFLNRCFNYKNKKINLDYINSTFLNN
jgi:hypothetical protein